MFYHKELKNALIFLGVLLLCHLSFADKPVEWDASLISKELDGSMPVWVRVVKNNEVQKLEGSFVAAFLNNELRAVQEYKDDDLFYYPMAVKSTDGESGYTFQFYNPITDKVYALILPEDKDPLQYQENGYGDLSYDEETQTEIFDALVLTLPTYSVTVENGTADVTVAGEDDTVTVTAAEPTEPHTVFSHWTVEGMDDLTDEQLKANPLEFTMPGNAVKLTANYGPEQTFAYTVDFGDGEPENGEAFEDDDVTVTPRDRSAEHKHFSYWEATGLTLTDEKANPLTFKMPANAVTLTAHYEDDPKYPFTVENGTPGNGDVYVGEAVTVTADNRQEQHELFDKWDVTGLDNLTDDDLKANPLMFAMPANAVTLTATYKPEPKVKFVVENGTPTSGEEYAGTKVRVTGVAPEEHMVFNGWTSSHADGMFDNKDEETTMFTLPQTDGTVTVTAEYVPEAKVKIIMVNGTSDNDEEYAGKWFPIAGVAPGEHKVFKGWTSDNEAVEFEDAEAEATKCRLPVTDATVTLTANYEDEPKYAVEVEYGTASLDEAYEGDSVTVTAEDLADDHLLFSGWTATGLDLTDAQKMANPLTFDMPANDVILTANYDDEPKYAVTVEKGKASPAETYAGEKVTVTADDLTADHLLFTGWTVVGIELTVDELKANPLEFDMPANDVTLTANYEEEPKYAVTVEKGKATVEEAYKDDPVTVTADPAEEDMEFDKWIGDVEFADETAESTSFTMPGNAVTVKATYRKAGYDEWPEDLELYAPKNGKIFREGKEIVFNWPRIRGAAQYGLSVVSYDGTKTFNATVEGVTYTVEGLDADSYIWNVTALDADGKVMKDVGTSLDFQFAVVEDNGFPVIIGAAADGRTIQLAYDTEEEGYANGEYAYQIFFFSLKTKTWTSLQKTLQVTDGQTIIDLGVDASNGYLYICPVTTPESNFVELYIE